jgi:allantoinase
MSIPNLGYSFSPQFSRPKFSWPNDSRIAVVFHFPLQNFVPEVIEEGTTRGQDLVNKPKVLGAVDLGNYTWKEFSYRVGVWRLMALFDRYNIVPSCPLALSFVKAHPSIMKEALARHWEFAAHGFDHHDSMDIFTGNEKGEREFIRRNLREFKRLVGRKSEGWVSPLVTPTINTARIIAEEGLKFYCDYQNDDQPYLIKWGRKSVVCVPYSTELSDANLYLRCHYSPNEVYSIYKDQFDYLYEEGTKQPKIMYVSIHLHIAGQAYRIPTLEKIIRYIKAHKNVWIATRGEIADWYLKQQPQTKKTNVKAGAI